MIRGTHAQPARAMSLVLVLILTAGALAPFASAQTGQRTFYAVHDLDGNSLDPGMGLTTEDDGAVASQPGGELDGVENKVILNTTDGIGTGGLFLDAVWYSDLKASWFDANHYATPVTGGRDMMFGSGGFMAWYGWWLDLDADGRIDDFHDSGSCPPTKPACGGEDEFAWRGVGSGSPGIEMALYVIPTNLPAVTFTNNAIGGLARFDDVGTSPAWRPDEAFGAWANASDASPEATFVDRTGHADLQQMWVNGDGYSYMWTDESLLLTTQSIVVANAEKSSSNTQYNLEDPEASIDVDIYEAYSPEAESLWVSTGGTVPQTYVDARKAPTQIGPMINGYTAMLSAAVNDVSRLINDLTSGQRPPVDIVDEFLAENVDPVVDDANEAADPYVGAAIDAANDVLRGAPAIPTTNPPWLKEPNHVGDVFPGATFSGVPGPAGIGNDYAAHASAHHLFMDGRLSTEIPDWRNVYIQPAGVSYGESGWLFRSTSEVLPCEACDSERGLTPTILGANVYATLWKDANGDKWPGRACDPTDAEEWDVATDTCNEDNDPRYEGFPSRVGGTDDWDDATENFPICGTTTLNGGGGPTTQGFGLKVYPAPGYTWEDAGGAMKIREYRRPMYNMWNVDEIQIPTGTEVVELELAKCTANEAVAAAVDGLYLATGTLGISLITEVTGTMTKAFKDTATGVSIPIESVTDIDVYLASL